MVESGVEPSESEQAWQRWAMSHKGGNNLAARTTGAWNSKQKFWPLSHSSWWPVSPALKLVAALKGSFISSVRSSSVYPGLHLSEFLCISLHFTFYILGQFDVLWTPIFYTTLLFSGAWGQIKVFWGHSLANAMFELLTNWPSSLQ